MTTVQWGALMRAPSKIKISDTVIMWFFHYFLKVVFFLPFYVMYIFCGFVFLFNGTATTDAGSELHIDNFFILPFVEQMQVVFANWFYWIKYITKLWFRCYMIFAPSYYNIIIISLYIFFLPRCNNKITFFCSTGGG